LAYTSPSFELGNQWGSTNLTTLTGANGIPNNRKLCGILCSFNGIIAKKTFYLVDSGDL